MTRAVRVRAARFDDLDTVVELRLALLREYEDSPLYAPLRADAADRARDLYFRQLLAPDEVMLLAERGDRVVGMLRCVETTGSPLLRPDRYCYISSVYVLPAERRRGVLRALMGAAEQWCAERGLDEMRLHNATSSSVAGNVWGAFGFDVVEQVRRRVLPTGNASPRENEAHAEGRAR